ncbi:hypothetical protein GCM10020001_088590 [Nonomuraea salmonea]
MGAYAVQLPFPLAQDGLEAAVRRDGDVAGGPAGGAGGEAEVEQRLQDAAGGGGRQVAVGDDLGDRGLRAADERVVHLFVLRAEPDRLQQPRSSCLNDDTWRKLVTNQACQEKGGRCQRS